MNVDHNKYEKNELINKYVEKLKGITASLIEKFNLLVTEVDSLLERRITSAVPACD